MLQEHHGVRLLKEANINVPPYGVAKTPEDAERIAAEIGKTIEHDFFILLL